LSDDTPFFRSYSYTNAPKQDLRIAAIVIHVLDV
jgi:hypothetical protein